MKAIVCNNWGPPSSLTLTEMPSPQPGPSQVLVRVQVAAVNFPDALIVAGQYQFRPGFPFSPGAELVGDIIAVYDPVGGEFAEPALRSVGWRGRYLVVGFASGDIPKIPINLLLLKGSALVGVFWGKFLRREPESNAGNMATLFTWLHEGKIRPLISKRYALSQAAALDALLAGEAVGKLVILPQQVG